MTLYSPDDRDPLLSVRLGITDWAAIEFKHSSEIWGEALDPEPAYRTDILPSKLAHGRAYVQRADVLRRYRHVFRDSEGVCRTRRPARKPDSLVVRPVVWVDQVR